jgi:hypothetical protein
MAVEHRAVLTDAEGKDGVEERFEGMGSGGEAAGRGGVNGDQAAEVIDVVEEAPAGPGIGVAGEGGVVAEPGEE